MSQYSIVALCRGALAAGFRLAGVTVIAVADAEEAAAECERGGAANAGLVLIEQQLLDGMNGEARRQLARRPLPILVPFPDLAWQTDRDRAEAYVADILRQAIGYRVRLQ